MKGEPASTTGRGTGSPLALTASYRTTKASQMRGACKEGPAECGRPCLPYEVTSSSRHNMAFGTEKYDGGTIRTVNYQWFSYL